MAQSDVQTKILEIEVNYSDALEKIAQYRIEIEKIKTKQKELKESVKESRISQEEYHKSMESSKLMINQISNSIGTLTKQVKNQIKEQNEQNGSLVKWRAQLSNLTAEYDRLSKAEREGAKGKELKEKINEITTSLKSAEEETQRFYRNVGNYPQAMAPMKEQLDILVAKLGEMKAAGLETSPAFTEMQEKAESLRDSLASASDENVMSFDKMNTGVMSLVTVFATWHTTLDGLGIKNEDLNKTLTFCMTGITAVATAGKVWNAVQKESALMTAATATKTWLLNTALAAKITAMTTSNVVTGQATLATKLWNAALYANPLVWLLGLVAAAAAAVYGLIKVFSLWTSSSEKQKEALEKEGEQLEQLGKEYEKHRARMSAMGATDEEIVVQTIKDTKAMADAHDEYFSKIAILYDEDEDEYKEALDAKKKATQDYLDALETGHNKVLSKIAESEDSFRKATMTEHEYAVYKIDKAYKNLFTICDEYYDKQLKDIYALNLSLDEEEKRVERINKIWAEETQKLKIAYQVELNPHVNWEIGETGGMHSEIKAGKTPAEKQREKQREKNQAEAARKAANARKNRAEEEKKLQEDLEKETKAGQDALLTIIKDGLDKQLKVEQLSYERQLKALQEKLAKYKTESEYDVKMRIAIEQQIEALEYSHSRKIEEFQWSEKERQIKIQEELLKSKLDLIKVNSEEETELRTKILDEQYTLELQALDKRLADELLTQEQYDALKLSMEQKYQQDKAVIEENAIKSRNARQKEALQAEIDTMQLAEDERQLRVRDGHERSEEAYAKWRERGLAGLEEHERNLLLKQEEIVQAELEALKARGQLSTQTTEEYEAEILAARQKSQQAQAATNQAIIKDEQEKAQAMKSITSSLTGLLDTLGENSKTFTRMSKIITLAQIAIDTGKAISAGVASATSMPFPANLAAIATTVATVIANVTTAISTVKSAKFAEGGKVVGPGTGTSDSIPAYLSNGEFVVTAKATKMFEPLLLAMNGIGKGIPMASPVAYDRITTAEMMTDSFETAAREIRPVVSAVEITEVQNRVSIIENLDTFD